MSTDYFLGCDSCKKKVPIWSISAGIARVIFTAFKYPQTVTSFLLRHQYHQSGIACWDEHDGKFYEYEIEYMDIDDKVIEEIDQ